MSGVNKAILVGNLGRDPEVKTFSNGNQMCQFTMATSESWRDKATGERKEKTEWHRVVIFSEALVKVCEQYLKKGSKIYIEGKIQTREWEKDGQKNYTTEIVMQGFDAKLVMLDGRDSGSRSSSPPPDDAGSSSSSGSTRSAGRSTSAEIDDDIPF